MSIPREHRLRKHAEFEVVYRCGQRHFSKALTAFYLLRPEVAVTAPGTSEGGAMNCKSSQEPRIGITVGRAMGQAVVRNRIKRRVRAAVTQSIGRLTRPLDIVINPKRVVVEIDFRELCAEVTRAFDVIEQKATVATDRSSQPAQQQRPANPGRLAARKH